MKGIILAGGTGSRLSPLTRSFSKHLVPIYDKPMIYYPLSTLMLSGIRDILIISTPRDSSLFAQTLGSGEQWGLNISYKIQPTPGGLPQAFTIGREFINHSPCALILGDNLFFGGGIPPLTRAATKLKKGAIVFAYRVNDPQRYGVVYFDKKQKPIRIEEKPVAPKSNYAITGIYFYDEQVADIASHLKPSARGELEISDINNYYLKHHQLDVQLLGRGDAWLDTGTPDSLIEASQFIQTIEKRQNLKVACPEEIAFRMGYINEKQLSVLAEQLEGSHYGDYLMQLVKENTTAEKLATKKKKKKTEQTHNS
jgi:glucose-1-phosphate thymidylyltransferase